MPYKSSVPLFWRLRDAKYSMSGTKCTTCNSVFFPPVILCPYCRRKGKPEKFKFSGNGEIFSYTVIRVAPDGFEKYAPYAVAIIKLDEGSSISGQVVGDIENVKIGKRVKSVFRKITEDNNDGLIHYGFKFAIVD
ncbi:MAG: Zn-ribbon domain-containing OB-fold protein [Nanoarchaeota archaeon]